MKPKNWLLLIATFFHVILCAQTGPAGIGNGAGTNGPRNVLWLDASSLGLTDGANVTSWSDLSGNGNTLTQQGADPTPTFAENAFGSGLHAIRFDGTERYLRIVDNPTLDGFADGVSIFLVTNFTTVDSSPRGILSKRVSSSSEEAYSLFTFTSSRLNFDVRTTDDNRLADGTTLSAATDYILSSVYDETFQYLSINGNGPSTRSETGNLSDASSDLILGALNDNYGTYFDGDLAEVIIYGSGLTQAERIIVENYLANKYSISVGTDLWSDNVTYSNDITGIGQESIYGSEATSGKSSLFTLSESTDFDNDDWLLIGHDNGDIATWTGTEVPGTEQRLAREWIVEETNDVGTVTLAITNSELPATGLSVPNYFLLVDTDGDADFSNATRYLMTGNGSGATATVDLNTNDRIALAFEGGDDSQVWYSYLSGNWNDPNNWTLDGAISPIYNNPSSEIPSVADSVVIQSGRTITMNVNDVAVTRLEIIGTLDLGATTGHTFGVLDGSGTLRLSGAAAVDNYPSTNDALFADAVEGGTLEYYGTGVSINNTRNARNLLINMTAPTDVFTTLSDIQINGNLTVANGIFQFNDNSATTTLNITVNGDVLVQGNGGIDVGTANARHQFNLYGDFINQGDVDFTNRGSQVTGTEATDGIVDVNFVSANQDQTVNLQNTTDFYRIEINKGVDDTYVVDLSATDPSYFNLYGFANSTPGGEQGANTNALGLEFGTIKVGNNITISPLNAGGNYHIFAGAQLWVNGGTVEKTGGTAIVPYGKIRVSAGTLNAPINSGITTRDNGQLILEGGTVTVNQFRTSIEGASALGGLVMSGGILNIIGGSTSTNYYTFSLTYPGNVFNMSGGVINLSGSNSRGGIYINSSNENISVTGGTVNIDVTNGNNATITSNAPFFNLNVLETSASSAGVVISNGTSGTGGGETSITLDNFKVLNDLHIDNSGGNGTTFNAGGIGLDITGSLTIDNGASVDFSNMNLTFEGLGSSSMNIGLATTLLLDSLELNKSDAFSNLNILLGQSTAIQIDEYLNITNGNFEIGMFDVTLNGALNLSDTIGTSSSTGQIYMNGGAAQVITSSIGAIYDLEIDNTNGVSLTGDLGVVDNFILDNGIFNIAENKLTLGTAVATNNVGGFGSTLMIQTSGNSSDGGIEYLIDGMIANPSEILYPFGTGSKYTPARLDLINVADEGYVQINPVNTDLLTTDLTGGSILGYYWRLRNRDFSTLPDVTTLSFTADAADLTGNVNLAVGKTATQSSTGFGGVASRANDGNTNGDFNGGNSVTHTNSDTEAYWTVDLGTVSNISSINVYNRTDCCGDRLQNYHVFVSDVAFTGTTVAESQAQLGVVEFLEAGQAGSPTSIVTGSITGRYVRIQLAGTNFLSLAEVEVIGPLNTASFLPGGVEDGVDSDDSPLTDTSFDRFYENNGFSSPDITFDGEFSDGSVQPFQLRTANYSLGESTRFVGAPEVFYTRQPGDGFSIKWDNGNNWTLAPNDIDGNMTIDSDELHDSRQPAAGDFPQAGDIAVIGWVPFGDPGGTDGEPHGIAADNQVVQFGELRFSQMLDNSGNPTERVFAYNFQFRPTLVINNSGGGVSGSSISGEGMFWIRSGGSQGDPDFTGIDLGDFVSEDSAYFVFESDNSSYVFDNIPSVVPNLLIAGNGWGGSDRDFEISTSLTVNQDFELLGDVNLILSSGPTGDIQVLDDLRIFRSTANGNDSGGFGRIDFPNDASRKIEVFGNLELSNQEALIQVSNPENTTQNISELIIHGNIEQDVTSNGGLQLYTAADEDYISLILSGLGSHEFNNVSGADATLYNLVLNKGSDTTNVFTVNSGLTINGDNTVSPQAIDLQNGLLVLNNPSLNLELSNGVDFQIPGSAGLTISQGTVFSTSSDLILSGLIRANGGIINLGGDIEYSNTGTALIDVSSGVLNVGGQVRRATSSTTGVLKYRQTGGDVDIATASAITTSRAAFEVLNPGSEFILTGGTFNIQRGVTGNANVSLLLDPGTSDLSNATITLFEGLGVDYGASVFNLTSTIPLNNLTLANTIDLPDVQLYTQNLEVNNLSIGTNQTLLSNGFNLTLNGDFSNEGLYTNTSTETIFAGSGAQNISGSGTYTIHTLRKSGSGTTSSAVPLSISNDFFLTGGTFDVGSNSLSLQNDAYIQSTFSNIGGNGLVFNGTANQDLNGLANTTVDIGTVTINNPSGVDIPDGNGYDFNITQELRLNGGVFNIGGSLVTMKPGAPITEVSAFNVNNMVQTNSSFTDNGLRIEFNTVAADTIVFFPIGELKYTPVQFELNAATTSGAIRVRPANERHPTIVNDTEPGTEATINDLQNVLDYHWIVVAETMTNATGSAVFFYDHDDIEVTAPYDTTNYISARLLSNNVNWDKFAPTEFKGGTQTFSVPLSSFSAAEITGDYTAGVGSSDGINNDIEGAIPDELAQYESVISGSGNYSTAVNWNPLGGAPVVTDGVGPVGAQITVKSGDEVTVDISDVRLFSTEIEEGGTLVIPAGVTGVRLGNVTGSGTIVLQDNELLPTGEYTDFLACDGGGLQYSGTTNYSVLSGISQIRKVIFDGSGVRNMPNNALAVCDTLIINGPTVAFDIGVTYAIGDADTDLFDLQSGSVSTANGAIVDVTGDFVISGGSFTGLTGTNVEVTGDMTYSAGTLNWNGTTVTLDGTTEQLLSGNFITSSAFDDLTLVNTSSSGVTINSGAVEVDGLLTLTDGLLNSTSSQTITLTTTGNWVGASPASYVTGPIIKNNIAATSNFTFPIGKAVRYAAFSIVNVGTGGQDWTGEYFTSLGAYPGSSFDDSDPGSGFNPLFAIESSDRWEITSSGSNTAQMRATYGSHNGHSEENNLRLVTWDGGDSRWENEGGQISGGVSSGTVTSENTVHFSTRQAAIGRAPSSTLPVELLEFIGTTEGQAVHLNWSTASEINNDRFEVEWSEDGQSFLQIGEVKGSGSTDELNTYHFIDEEPIAGLNYYRFRQVDYDGQFEYSPIIAVTVQEFFEEAAFKVYPNPVTESKFNVNLSGFREGEEITLTVMNLSGKKVWSQQIEATDQDYEVNLPMGTPRGIYTIIYQFRDRVKSDKLLITR